MRADLARTQLTPLLLAALLACSPAVDESPGTGSEPVAGGTVVTTNLTDVDTLNDLISDGSVIARDVERMLFLRLARELDEFENGIPKLEPQLAERWEFSPDGLELTFHLREALWSDGEPITAEDVRWTWEAQTHPAVAWRGAQGKSAIREVEVVDERTVTFHFDRVYPGQLLDANDGSIFPRHVWSSLPFEEWRSNASWFVDRMVGSGPFRLSEWAPNQRIEMVRNEHHYLPDQPLLDRLVIQVIPEKTNQINQLLGGSVDLVQVVPPDQIERIEADSGLAVDAYWGRAFDYLCWNVEREPLDRSDVRRALTLGVDRQSIVDSVYRGYARVGVTSILTTTWAFDASLTPWPYDPAGARELLGAAGYEPGSEGILQRQGDRLTLELIVQSGARAHVDAATLIQAHLGRIGVEVELRPLQFQAWLDRVKGNDFDVAIGGWNIPTTLDMTFAFHSDSIGGYNFGAFSNADLDRALDGARLASDIEEKRRYLEQVQGILHREQPYTFLWEPQRVNARSASLRGTRPNALSAYFDVGRWWRADP